jgi:predicted metal-dependent HD superfamily phosphohydrolase
MIRLEGLSLGIDNPRTAITRIGLPVPPSSVFDDLLGHYSENSRAYHTTQHLEECFEQFALVPHLCRYSGEVQVALWFHDSIYDTRSSRNEERSAAWATSVLAAAGAPTEVQLRVSDLVLATRHDLAPVSADASVLVDIDLSILGALPSRFDEYEVQIRREYSWVSEPAFRQGRIEILRKFLARPFVYSTPLLRERLEARARSNLARALSRLGA